MRALGLVARAHQPVARRRGVDRGLVRGAPSRNHAVARARRDRPGARALARPLGGGSRRCRGLLCRTPRGRGAARAVLPASARWLLLPAAALAAPALLAARLDRELRGGRARRYRVLRLVRGRRCGGGSVPWMERGLARTGIARTRRAAGWVALRGKRARAPPASAPPARAATARATLRVAPDTGASSSRAAGIQRVCTERGSGPPTVGRRRSRVAGGGS